MLVSNDDVRKRYIVVACGIPLMVRLKLSSREMMKGVCCSKHLLTEMIKTTDIMGVLLFYLQTHKEE